MTYLIREKVLGAGHRRECGYDPAQKGVYQVAETNL